VVIMGRTGRKLSAGLMLVASAKLCGLMKLRLLSKLEIGGKQRNDCGSSEEALSMDLAHS